MRTSRRGWSLIAWKQYADLGLLGVPFAEEHGGTGGGPVETMIVMEQIGRALVLEPYLATVVLGGGLLRRGGSRRAARRASARGSRRASSMLAFAHAERQARYDLADVATTARRDGGGYVLDGAKSAGAAWRQRRKSSSSRRASPARRPTAMAWRCFWSMPRRPACRVRGYPTVDGLRAAEVTLPTCESTLAPRSASPASAFPLIERVVDQAIAALVRRSGRRHGGACTRPPSST